MSSLEKAPEVQAVIVLDSDGKRIAAKYYKGIHGDIASDKKKQVEFEELLHKKTWRTNARMDAEVVVLDKCVAVYRFVADAFFYIVGSKTENELILQLVLSAIEESMMYLLR
jgi:coatomer subunit zeta